jgi:hypothetical protein
VPLDDVISDRKVPLDHATGSLEIKTTSQGTRSYMAVTRFTKKTLPLLFVDETHIQSIHGCINSRYISIYKSIEYRSILVFDSALLIIILDRHRGRKIAARQFCMAGSQPTRPIIEIQATEEFE